MAFGLYVCLQCAPKLSLVMWRLTTSQITLFTLGGMRWIEMDYDGEEIENIIVQESLRMKQKKVATAFASLVGQAVHHLNIKKQHSDAEMCIAVAEGRVSIESDDLTSGAGRRTCSQDEKEAASSKSEIAPSLSIIISFIISMVPTLKALFVSGVPGVHISPAPDGQPPLAILMNTATFIGGASVPLGLICLGSALTRLRGSHDSWRSLPIASISALAAARLIIMPVLGVIICQGLTHAGVIDSENKVLRFVCMYDVFLGCMSPPDLTYTVQFRVVPTNVNITGMMILASSWIGLTGLFPQVYLTQIYSGTGTATHLAAFLVPQYILMLGTMTGLTSYTLHLLFG
ncbi:hypothetical protein SCLCIDRAFT_1221578 [Scleroderma citrinum Foug A]|uniref:Auxin efflux carrier n=1 Tax=Scleroderma citrinum Foug A TaxID=1036808 RepID=A0A0C3D2B2_9AGAM|nr:hypothetical protein SCLCIDRAFT_1221578 [Scleroderma citrinum Foug A]